MQKFLTILSLTEFIKRSYKWKAENTPHTEDLWQIGSSLGIFVRFLFCRMTLTLLFAVYGRTLISRNIWERRIQTLLQGGINHNYQKGIDFDWFSLVSGQITWGFQPESIITTFWTLWTVSIQHKLSELLNQGKKVQNFSRNFSRLSQQELSKMETEMKAIQQEILNCAGLGELQKDAEILKFL